MQRVARGGSGVGFLSSDAIVTKILVVLNVVIYLITVAQGAGLNSPGGSLFNKWALYGPLVHHGDWWRLITSAFLHGGLLHITFNMLALWWLGAPVEMVLGRARYLGLYFVSGLAARPARCSPIRTPSRSAPRARSSACSAPGSSSSTRRPARSRGTT
jgi:membrane associated rhomboid family serine protease